MNTLSSPFIASSAVQFGRNDQYVSDSPHASRRPNNHRSRLNGPETEGLTRNLFEDRFVNMNVNPANRGAANGQASLQAPPEAVAGNATITNGEVTLNPIRNGVASAAYELT